MTWVRIDDGFAEHPKISSLTDREFRIWVTLLCFCGRQEDPTVDRITMRHVRGLTPKFVSKLKSLSLLDKGQNAYEIHDWSHYRPKDETGAERQARWRARRDEQAKDSRYATVTESVTETVTPDRYADRYETVTPEPEPGSEPALTPSVSDPPTNPSNEPPLPDEQPQFVNPQNGRRWNTDLNIQPIGATIAEEGGK